MARVKVEIIGADKFRREQLAFVKNLADKQIREIALITEDVIKQKITDSITRAGSTGNLANSFFAEPITGGWGIGNITFLNVQAPYWRHVNFGSQAIGASHNHLVPQGAFQPGNSAPVGGGGGQRWQVGSGTFAFRPNQPIAPRNYIAKTLQEIPRITSSVLNRG